MGNFLSIEKRKQIFHLLCEGNGVRSISRVVGCHSGTIQKFRERYFGIIEFITRRKIFELEIDEIEADEIRTFVFNKTNLRWVYIALDRKSRMVVHFHIGKRDTNDAKILLAGLSAKLHAKCQISTDCLSSYISAIKKFPNNVNPSTKYHSVELLRSKFFGEKLGRAITNRVETQNGNVRQHVSSLSRRTRCFSKSGKGLYQHLFIYFFYYNFIKVHKSIKTAPCVAAGIISNPFSFEKLLEYDSMITGNPGKRGMYEPRKNIRRAKVISINPDHSDFLKKVVDGNESCNEKLYRQQQKSKERWGKE